MVEGFCEKKNPLFIKRIFCLQLKSMDKKIIDILKKGGIGVLPTDTIYGLVGLALDKEAVERIYKVRKRDSRKPFIILINSLKDLDIFSVKINGRTEDFLKKIWPGPVSVILPISDERQETKDKFRYLHRDTGTLAFRLPKNFAFRTILKKTGPLVAPSANIAGQPSAFIIKEAKKYFGGSVDFYVDGGKLNNNSSSLVEVRR